jgi:trehalose synthase
VAPAIAEIELARHPLSLLRDELAPGAWDGLQAARAEARVALDGRRVWSINSTARGGGAAELARTLLPYWRGEGLDVRWLVIEAGRDFFRLTKRLHNLLHGSGAEPALGLRDRALFERVGRALGARVAGVATPGDVVLLHDPQTAGLVPGLKRAGAVVVWRCHVGADRLSPPVEAAWSFLAPFISPADAYVFTRRGYVPPALDRERVHLVTPAIDPLSSKNRPLSAPVARAILHRNGLASDEPARGALAMELFGGHGHNHPRPDVLRASPPPRLGRERLVVALARWDRLTDPVGIVRAFGRYVAARDVRLIVAGPAVDAVADDPEAPAVWAETRDEWRRLPASRRARIDLATLPLADLEENAVLVNALQRQAAVVLKKSVQEGFGLGVTEACWKARPVIATRVGGQQDQIEHRRTGLLVDDPRDPAAFGAALNELLANPGEGLELALAGRRRVRERYLADRHFVGWMGALGATLTRTRAPRPRTHAAAMSAWP